MFIVRQHALFVGRVVLSFVSGGERCLVCGSMSFAVPVCRDCRKKDFALILKRRIAVKNVEGVLFLKNHCAWNAVEKESCIVQTHCIRFFRIDCGTVN